MSVVDMIRAAIDESKYSSMQNAFIAALIRQVEAK